jgi:hypothetical protein
MTASPLLLCALVIAGLALASGNDGTMSPQNLAAYPTCVEYQGDQRLMAHIQGAAVDARGTPAVSAHRVLRANDGRVFRAVTDDAGYFILDVAVHPRVGHPLSFRVDGSAARMVCLSPRVTIG